MQIEQALDVCRSIARHMAHPNLGITEDDLFSAGQKAIVKASAAQLPITGIEIRTALLDHVEAAGRITAGGRPLRSLPKRQLQVARLAATGRSNKEIADELGIAPKTVDVHLTTAYRNLGVHGRWQLMRLMIAEGLVDTQPDVTLASLTRRVERLEKIICGMQNSAVE